MKINHEFISPYNISGQYADKRNIAAKQAATAAPINTANNKVANKSAFGSFEAILSEQIAQKEELKFSKHADNRLSERNITLTDEQLKRLEDGTEKARDKGIKESLVLVDEMAFIVSIKNNTVVTAMNKGEFDSVFTNIDGAVIM